MSSPSDDLPRVTGTIDGVRIEIGDDDHSHLIEPEHLLEIALMTWTRLRKSSKGRRCQGIDRHVWRL